VHGRGIWTRARERAWADNERRGRRLGKRERRTGNINGMGVIMDVHKLTHTVHAGFSAGVSLINLAVTMLASIDVAACTHEVARGPSCLLGRVVL
jgi:hypothetical protein